MGTTIDIRGVPIQFPFKPYDIQKDYMSKVIECLQNETTAVLESPTGTGKTLCLLCSTLAWLQLKQAEVQAARRLVFDKPQKDDNSGFGKLNSNLKDILAEAAEMMTGKSFFKLPTIIYASRTHSQLTQAVQELKRSAYNHMKASVLGSRDQLCIHPEVIREQDRGLRLQMCRMKMASKSCHFHNRTERFKDDPKLDTCIIDIEDMVKLGEQNKFCPYYMTKEQQLKAHIIFTPYNYLLDPIARKALGLSLENSVVILDEAHNIERVCEESASVELKSTDIALAIDEVTGIMKLIAEVTSFEDSPKDIDADELATFKEILLNFEKVLDEVPLNSRDEVQNFPGDYIFEILEKANINVGNSNAVMGMIDKIVQFLTTKNDGPFARNGKALQLFSDFLTVVFASKATRDKVKWCYKVHIKEEEQSRRNNKQMNTWLSKGSTAPKGRILNFWCFSPGFGMDMILSNNIKALILTSGTLAPLKPFISELELDVTVSLENPHIVNGNQICVKILSSGPDGEKLNSSYQNRTNPSYITSLGRTIVNLSRIIPEGLLIFFPTYPVMHTCQAAWQEDGLWANINSQKPIFVEPKERAAFQFAMTGYYEKIRDPNLKGAIFMAVCKGKVSEGLDFSDANGRAVIITGLPFPPLKDPRVILKRRYLDQCHAKNKEYLTGQDWYSLEASRAVNQAVGRVIRHRHDYGAILLLDERFNNFKIKDQMSKWLKGHIKVINKYGEVIRDLSQFYKRAQNELPAPRTPTETINTAPATFDTQTTNRGNFDFSTSSASISSNDSSVMPSSSNNDSLMNLYTNKDSGSSGLVTIHNHKRENQDVLENQKKRKKITLKAKSPKNQTEVDPKLSMAEFVTMVKSKLGANFSNFYTELTTYRKTRNVNEFIAKTDSLVPHNLKYIFVGMYEYIPKADKNTYQEFLRSLNLAPPEDF